MDFDTQIERKIVEKGLTAPRVTKEQIDKLAKSFTYRYHVFEGTTVTVCAVFLDSFILAHDYSASVSKENFDEEIGRDIAKDRAKAKAIAELWKLEGYALRNALKSVS